jgi:phosphoribosylformylglycinamidine cyclo-ligase
MVALKKRNAPLTYKEAGVDIEAGDEFVARIAQDAIATASARLGASRDFGRGYGALFDLKAAGFVDPVLVSSTDGVGTKLRIAIDTGILNTIGIDLVAMCVNDILCRGAEPLFFLDYFACGRIDRAQGPKILEGIITGCKEARIALVGGETAEMPDFYRGNDFDLAGFAVGAAERDRTLPRFDEISEGDLLIGLASSGVHSNGFSFVRRVVLESGLKWSDPAPFAPHVELGRALLEPTRIYVGSIVPLLGEASPLKALAHITGSAHAGKLGRIIPDELVAHINLQSWTVPAVFHWLGQESQADRDELLRTFNCGIGMVAIVDKMRVDAVLEHFKKIGLDAFVVGSVERRQGVPPVRFSGYLKFAV